MELLIIIANIHDGINIFFEKYDEAYAKYSKNNIWLITEYDKKKESMIELLEDIKRNTDFIGKASK